MGFFIILGQFVDSFVQELYFYLIYLFLFLFDGPISPLENNTFTIFPTILFIIIIFTIIHKLAYLEQSNELGKQLRVIPGS